jgi:Protein of unknown function (DUF3095)
MDTALNEAFFDTLPVFEEFEGVADAARYRPLPDSWWLASADIVSSTQAIAAGRYKAVNTAGASVISAVLNAVGSRELPFVFGGDGALVAVPASAVDKTREALAACRTWVQEELDLALRAALVPMIDVRREGLDVRVARFQASSEVSYAMFAGGGASWVEAEMKAGRYTIEPAPPGSRPDLTGLSCRWNPIEARNGEIVSLIVLPGGAGNDAAFQQLVGEIVAIAGEQDRGGHPVPAAGPAFHFPPGGVEIEARAAAPRGKRLRARLNIMFECVLAITFDWLGRSAGRFDPRLYRRDLASNTDFRKFDDGLKMTVDIEADRLARIETRLAEAAKAGHCRYGLHRQGSALMTCIVPSPFTRDHMHFIDGAAGGYAMAARNLKATYLN